MTRATGRQTVATADDWYGLAEKVLTRVDAAPHGEREPIYNELAGEMGVSAHVPRRLARAIRFLRYVEQDVGFAELAQRLRTQPVSSISVVARWANHSPDAALAAAQKLVDGEINLAGVTALEERDRKAGSRIAAATDKAWQEFATQRAVDLVSSTDGTAKLIWSAKGWGVGGPRIEIKAPGLLGKLDHLPNLHLVFARPARSDRRDLAVSILTSQRDRPRSPTHIAQVVLTLSGYARVGVDTALLCGLTEDLEVAKRILDQLGEPSDVAARLVDLN